MLSRLLMILLILGLASTSFAQDQSPETKCLICHGKWGFFKMEPDGQKRDLFIDTTLIRSSVHSRWTCTDCHASVTAIPHQPIVPSVECTRCHYVDNKVGAPQGQMYDQYKESVHGIAASNGNPKAPHCQNCHGTHNIRRPSDPISPISRQRVASTCGQCHVQEFAEFSESIHGKQAASGNLDAPVCINCHGEHDILARSSDDSKVNPANIPNTCSACHASEAIMSQYGVKNVQVETYNSSFHGIAVKFGQKRAANCSSCHGFHDILPAADPRSRVNVANIPKTCGGCHQDANANYARGQIHINAEEKEAGVIYYIAFFFKYLTIGTLGILAVNILLDLRRKLTHKKRPNE